MSAVATIQTDKPMAQPQEAISLLAVISRAAAAVVSAPCAARVPRPAPAAVVPAAAFVALSSRASGAVFAAISRAGPRAAVEPRAAGCDRRRAGGAGGEWRGGGGAAALSALRGS